MKKKNKALSVGGIVVAVLFILAKQYFGGATATKPPTPVDTRSGAPAPSSVSKSGADAVLEAFRAKRSGVMVELEAEVAKVLPDDNKGSRHQRFLLRVTRDHAVLVAHNIDLAPRVPDLKRGDTVTVFGQFEYNIKGGVLHWTHHDPRKRREGGWIEFNGKRYE